MQRKGSFSSLKSVWDNETILIPSHITDVNVMHIRCHYSEFNRPLMQMSVLLAAAAFTPSVAMFEDGYFAFAAAEEPADIFLMCKQHC